MSIITTHDTIVALSTPRGSGALAVVRLSGPQSWPIAELLTGKKFTDTPSHTIHAAKITVDGNVVDHVMIALMRGPRTFTGEDTVEITCHNNEHIHQAIIDACIHAGARLAQQGEFTRQATSNGKIDLLQAEAINELIHAQTQQALKQSLAQVAGTLSGEMARIEQQLVKSLAWCEASFEFLDEGGDFKEQLSEQLSILRNELDTLLQSFTFQHQTRGGYRIALLGTVNAGKSSLFNMLLGTKRAIVSPHAGTTRDSIEATLIHNGNTFTFIDTAGLRTTADSIEAEGIERSYHEAQSADVLLLVVDSSRELTSHEQAIYEHILADYGQKTILVYNKHDIHADVTAVTGAAHTVNTSTTAHPHESATKLFQALDAHVAHLAAQHQAPFLLNKRHQNALTLLRQELSTILELLAHEAPAYELISYHLRQALVNLSELTGKSISEAALDKVFKEFCVGK